MSQSPTWLPWRQAGESVAFADEMGLIEVAAFVDDVGPGPARCVATSDQRPVKPDRSCKQFWRHPDLGSKTTLELTGTEARFCNEVLDPRTAPECDHLARREADRAVRAALVQHHPDPAFDGGDTELEVRCRAHGVAENRSGFAENIRGCGILMTSDVMLIPTNRFKPVG